MTKTFVVTGGGSGGHITPILAVAAELKRQLPDCKIVYIGQIGDILADLPAKDPNIDQVFAVRAGKFRRYHGEGIAQLLDFKTVYLNIRDLYYIAIGTFQSWRLLRQLRPDVLFTRGGYVSVPVAFGGAALHIPYITHDSDSTPSLANRIIARWAALHAVALPAELYPYPAAKTRTVGVPISHHYQPVTPALQNRYRHTIGFEKAKQVLVITGGGNGARQLNTAIIDNASYLLERYPDLYIAHFTGRMLEEEAVKAYGAQLRPEQLDRVTIKAFSNSLYEYSGAADVVIARGGATNLAEFAAQGLACIIVPSKQLIWNVKNTDTLAKLGAVIKLTEQQSEQELRLAHTISELLDDAAKRTTLGTELAKLARPQAAKDLADILIELSQ